MNVQRRDRRVLLVDDDPVFIERAREILSSLAQVRVVGDADAALAENLAWRPELIMLDALFGTGDSFALLDALKQARPMERIGIICLTKGRGALNHMEPFADEVFGMIRREPEEVDLRLQVEEAVRLTDRLRIGVF
jgi:PleD family two-component response regulator